MAINGCAGAVFDLDGVITETATIHFKAWKAMFDDFLKSKNLPEFTEKDYLSYVDGKPRYDGVQSFLDSRKVSLPYGSPDDKPEKQTVCGLGNKKNEQYQKIIKQDKPHVFQSSVRFVKQLKKQGLKVGIASSSKNTKLILKLTGLTSLFDTIVDGIVSAKEGLQGKPEPDIFIRAAENMGVRPAHCIVVEDAVSGVQAGSNGHFGLVVGVRRGKELLKAADIEVKDLGELTITKVRRWFSDDINKKGWVFDYHSYSKEGESVREAICAVGNGYLATRGCHATERDNSAEHYPGTYLAGIYNKQATKIHGKDIWNNDFVNCPNWLLTIIKVDGKELRAFDEKNEIIDYHQRIDLKNALLIQEITVKDDKEQLTRIKTTRFASMNDAHTVGQKVEVTPLTYDAKITIQSLIDADVINNNVARYRQLKSKHLTFKDKGKTKDILNVQVQTNASKHDIVYTAKNAFSKGKKNLSKKTLLGYKNIGQEAQDQVPKKTTIAAEKLVTIYTSRESENPLKDAEKTIDPKTFTDELKAHKQEWKKLWKDADVSIKGDIWTQQVIRLHIYHLLSTASPHNKHLDAGMPARGLVGEGYRGHIFWDTLYVLPFFGLRFPEIAQALLKYRYRRIAGAERYAQEFGYDGAMYPWQTADSGDEETQTVHYNPNSKTWGPDMSSRQRHVSIAIFVNFWRYYKLTDDVNFLREYGTDVMLQIARFWASIAQYDKKDKRYHIEGVMGPDEFHEKLPRSKKPGVKDNTYTNLMVSWLLEKTITLAEMFPDKTLVSEEEIQKWKDISNNLNISIRNSILEQFVGYFKLPELDWKKYEKKYGDIHRMDRILKAEGKSPDSYKVTKQADVLMPYFVLDINEVTAILRKLGVNVSDKQSFFKKNYRYYEKRTSHGSTLSKIVHGIISSYMHDDKLTWSFFNDVLVSDVSETIRKDSAEGIHTGLMAGTVDYVVRRFAGVNYQKEQLEINPKLPKDWEEISFRIQHRGVWYDITVTQKKVTVATSRPATLIYRNSPWKVTKSSSKAL